MMNDLCLNLKGEYFDEISSLDKKWEFRLYNEYWKNRLIGKKFARIVLKRGYPRKDDMSRQLIRPWQSYVVKMITHPHFGPDPVRVFAIKVN
jgi:hypothetical protein